MTKKNLHTLTIDKLVPGGFGLGRLANGIIVLVRHVLPGEKVLISEAERKKDYMYAALKEVLQPSMERIEPPCPVYGRCGGCDLQHAAPESQLRLKKTILGESLQRGSSTLPHDRLLPIEEPLVAPAPFNYRQRLRLQVDDQGKYGFFQPESHSIVPVTQCLLAKKQLNSVLKQLHALNSFHVLVKHSSAFELLNNPDKDRTILLLHFLRKPRPAYSSLAADLKGRANGLSAIIMLVEGYGLYDPLERTFAS
ncbi:MAG: class I SAM-dependent RNA methyltransferase, partial [Deltaproteobacteria bacterium]|nr:class I SAM-dependent RNA methyltransferase [Deltaproteobacteria bacterium]